MFMRYKNQGIKTLNSTSKRSKSVCACNFIKMPGVGCTETEEKEGTVLVGTIQIVDSSLIVLQQFETTDESIYNSHAKVILK